MESALNTSIFGMLVARRLSPKRYANFAKSVVDHLEHLALYHLMWNPKNRRMDQTFFQKEKKEDILFQNSRPFWQFPVRPNNDNGGTRVKLLIENKSTLRNGFNGSLY